MPEASATPLSARARLSLPAIVSVALVIALGVQAAQLPRVLARPSSPVTDARLARALPRPLIDTRVVIDAQLFGRAPEAVASIRPAPDPANYQLSGVMAQRDPRSGFAVIGTQSGQPKLVRAGQILADGVQLLEVYRDRVVLARANQRMEIRLRRGNGLSPPPMPVDPELVARLIAPESADAPVSTPEAELKEAEAVRRLNADLLSRR